MSEGLVLLTSEENPIYFNPSPVLEDEVRLASKYKGKCLFELYETKELEPTEEDSNPSKEMARYVVVWDDEYGQPLTVLDGVWVESKGCVSNAVVATGAFDEIRNKYSEWFQLNLKDDQGPIGVGYDQCAIGALPKEVKIERETRATIEEAKDAISAIFNAYLTNG